MLTTCTVGGMGSGACECQAPHAPRRHLHGADIRIATIIVVQWADLDIRHDGCLSANREWQTLHEFRLLFETILGACVCFVPFLNAALQTRPLRFTHWMPGMPFMVLIFLYDEVRKYLMRTGSKDVIDPQTGQVTKHFNWVGENTYY